MRPVLYVDPQRCQTCSRCQARATCRTRALTQFEPGELPVIETQRCLGCQVCVKACIFGAIGLLGASPAGAGHAKQP